MRIPAVTVTINGKQYQTNEIVLNVVKPGTTDQLELEVTLSQEKCYVGPTRNNDRKILRVFQCRRLPVQYPGS